MSAVSQTAKNYRVLLKHIKSLPSAENWKGRVVEQVTCVSYVISLPNLSNSLYSFLSSIKQEELLQTLHWLNTNVALPVSM